MNTNEAISKPYEVIAEQCVSPHLMYRRLRKNEIRITDWWDYLEHADKGEVLTAIGQTKLALKRLKEFRNSTEYKRKIRKYVNYMGHSDVIPHEVIAVINPSTVVIRQMSVTKLTSAIPLGVGGFGVTFDNSGQGWECSTDESNHVSQIHLGNKGWGQGKYIMSDKPVYFYDFNF